MPAPNTYSILTARITGIFTDCITYKQHITAPAQISAIDATTMERPAWSGSDCVVVVAVVVVFVVVVVVIVVVVVVIVVFVVVRNVFYLYTHTHTNTHTYTRTHAHTHTHTHILEHLVKAAIHSVAFVCMCVGVCVSV
jgi:hypothetical protein